MTHRLSKQFINVTDVVYLRKVKKSIAFKNSNLSLRTCVKQRNSAFHGMFMKHFQK